MEKIKEAFGEVSALFMSQECKGTEIVMPTEDLERISEQLQQDLKSTILEKLPEEKINLLGDNYRLSEQDIGYNQAIRETISLINSL